MEFRRLLLSALLISCLFGITIAGTGKQCGSDAYQLDTQGNIETALASGGFTLDTSELGTAVYDIETTRPVRGGRNAPTTRGASNYNRQDECKDWDSLVPENYFYAEWTPNQDFVAYISLTQPNEERTFSTRLTIYSTPAVDGDTYDCEANVGTGVGTRSTNSDNIAAYWDCEGHIVDLCTGPRAFTFTKGLHYVFLFDSPANDATHFVLHAQTTPILELEKFEGAQDPAGWTVTKAASATSGWEQNTVSALSTPKFSISSAKTNWVGNVGNIYAINPTRCNSDGAACVHTDDVLKTATFDFTTTSSIFVEFDSLFIDGTSTVQTTVDNNGYFEVSTDNGASWTLVHNAEKSRQATESGTTIYFWEIVRYEVDTQSSSQVIFRFRFRSNRNNGDHLYGWAINNFRVFANEDIDMCNDGFACTTDTCNNEEVVTKRANENIKGCVHENDDAVCESNGDGSGCKVWSCDPTAENHDLNGCTFGTDDSQCDDDISCTVDTCDEAGDCVYTPTNSLCNDNKACTDDTCEPTNEEADGNGCVYETNCVTADGLCGTSQCGDDGNCVLVPDDADCDDGKSCTDDVCGDDGVCSNTPNCANNGCAIGGCNTDGVCETVPDNDECNDNKDCTDDTCEPTNEDADGNGCVFTVNCADNGCSLGQCDGSGNCENVDTDSECNDGRACTENTCAPSDEAADGNGCVYTVGCDDGYACTVDSCDAAGVCHHDASNLLCNDGKGCTSDVCDPSNEAADADGCVHELSCDDHVDCTDDSCEEAAIGGDRCLHTVNNEHCEDFIGCTYELVCDPEQPGFDPVSGCIRIPMDLWCDDENPCTIDTCEPYRDGFDVNDDKCFHEAINCDDCIPCTTDTCDEASGECLNVVEEGACDDDVYCTNDYCDLDLGKCVNVPVDNLCYGHAGDDGCDVFTCRPGQDNSNEWGCVAEDKNCDDDLHCTTDTCEEGACQHEANDAECDDGPNRCTDDSCSKELHKCLNVPNSENCDDNNACTLNWCGYDGVCHYPEISCDDDIKCTEDLCDEATGCYNVPRDADCDDGFDCTDDKCDEDLGRCTNLPSDNYCASVGDLCHTWTCNVLAGNETSGCYGVPVECSDGIPCTFDYCDIFDGSCKNVPIPEACDDGFNCTDDYCDEIFGCVNHPNNANCDDGDACTTDVCGCDGQCEYTEKDCDDQIACTVDSCEDGVCKNIAPVDACDDGISCTNDYCDLKLGRCVNIPVNSNCKETSECTTATCSLELDCVYENHHEVCDDHVPCTDDVCLGWAGCANNAYDSLCDDGLGCTKDTCDKEKGGCYYDAIDERCEDGYNCTTNICSAHSGCQIDYNHDACEDSIHCTADFCTTDGCDNYPMDSWCSDGIACTIDTCNETAFETNYCSHETNDKACDDGWDCSTEYCDAEYGCVYDTTECPWHTQRDPLCIDCQSENAQILQLNYTDGTGAIQFATKNPVSKEVTPNLVATPTDQFLIGAADQNEIHIGRHDGLVLNDNIRIVPIERGTEPPVCNEIRRGTIIVREVEEACGERVCHRDQIQICSKQQDYEWVPLSN